MITYNDTLLFDGFLALKYLLEKSDRSAFQAWARTLSEKTLLPNELPYHEHLEELFLFDLSVGENQTLLRLDEIAKVIKASRFSQVSVAAMLYLLRNEPDLTDILKIESIHADVGQNRDPLFLGVLPQKDMTFGFTVVESSADMLNPNQHVEQSLSKRSIIFQLAKVARSIPTPVVRFEEAWKNLEIALEEIIQFAKSKNVLEFAKNFERSLNILKGKDGFRDPSQLWSVTKKSSKAHQLFTAARMSDVFKQMGSWNDLQIDHDSDYRQVSNQMCLCIAEAIGISLIENG